MNRRGLDLVDFSSPAGNGSSLGSSTFAAASDLPENPGSTPTYEDGYRSGWDDAVRAAEEKERGLSAELERNLRDLGFSYFEAREEIMRAVRPFLSQLLDSLFPELLSEIAACAVAETLVDHMEKGCDGEVALLVSPEDADVVRRLLPEHHGLAITIREEPTLGSGQVHARPASREIVIDAERVLAQLRHAVSASHPTREVEHG